MVSSHADAQARGASELPNECRRMSRQTLFQGLLGHRNLAVQRGLSGNAGAQAFSRSIYLAPVLEALAYQIYPPVGQASRQPEGSSVRVSPPAKHSDLRLGLGSYRHLWPSRRSENRLQPQKTRQAFLPSSALFRSPFPRVLAWHSQTGQHHQFHRSRPLSQNLFGQSTAADRQKPHPLANGFGFLPQP